MGIERKLGDLTDRGYNGRAQRNVWDKMAVHDIDVNYIGPSLLCLPYLAGEMGKVGGKD
jgi:hypothetical protein